MAQTDYFESEAWAEVEREELEYIFGQEQAKAKAEPRQLTGIAISGGGIRSASFGLGVLQALVRKDRGDEPTTGSRLSGFDYLSTVSGGGYIGSSLTWFLRHGKQSESRLYGTQAKDFPFGQAIPGEQAGDASSNELLDFIRQHGNYLVPGSGLNSVSIGSVVIRAMSASLLIYGGLMVGVMAVGLRLDDLVRASVLDQVPVLAPLRALANPLLGLAVLAVVGFVTLSLALSLMNGLMIKLGRPSTSYGVRTWSQRVSGMAMVLAIVSAFAALIPIVYNLIFSDMTLIASAAGSTGAGAGIGGRLAMAQQAGRGSGKAMTALLYLAAALVIFGVMLGCYAIAFELHIQVTPWLEWVSAVVFGGALAAGWLLNINYLSLHRMYRDRLMETFMPNLATVFSGKWSEANDADNMLIEDICFEPNRRPYHLINTNVVLVDSDKPKYRSRGGTSFVMSRLFCGSRATGWRRSSTWKVSDARGMTLPTAMAISGAAANPNTGLAGGGLMRTRAVSMLMSLLNVRLGYWAPNPRHAEARRNPNYLRPGIDALLGIGLDEGQKFVELSDGGHFENLGLYELIRRRVDLIVASDGGADPDFDFADLANAIERVRVDFDVKIEFEEAARSRLIPGSIPEDKLDLAGELKLAERGFAVLKVFYPADARRGLAPKVGTLVYLKTTLVGGLAPDLYSYKLAHPSFPDETTADQFFDEKQFEAYRELGYGITRQMLESKDWKGGPEKRLAPKRIPVQA